MRPPRPIIPAVALLISFLLAFLVVGVLWVAGAPLGQGVESIRWHAAVAVAIFVLVGILFVHFCP